MPLPLHRSMKTKLMNVISVHFCHRRFRKPKNETLVHWKDHDHCKCKEHVGKISSLGLGRSVCVCH